MGNLRSKGGIFDHCKEDLMHETRYHKLLISIEDISLYLIFSFTSFKIEFNPLTIRRAATLSSIFEATALTYFSFSDGIEKLP